MDKREREYLVVLRVKADYSNDGSLPYRGMEDVILVDAADRFQALDRALGTRNIASDWYVYSIDCDDDALLTD